MTVAIDTLLIIALVIIAFVLLMVVAVSTELAKDIGYIESHMDKMNDSIRDLTYQLAEDDDQDEDEE